MEWILFAVFFAACAAAAATGSLFPPGPWYEKLEKPPWNPPNWVFPVVWTPMYIAIAFAASRVAMLDGAGLALAFWSAQIAYNALWTPVFFGLRRMRGALIVMAGLWLTVAGTLITFLQLDLIAGLIFVPYLIWVTIAGALNLSVVRRNPDAEAAPVGA